MLINWVLAAIVLFNAESWAALMVVVTGYHIVGYMAAPISMGAIAPKTRWAGLVVFVLLGLIMLTIPAGDLMMMNSSLTILLLLYACVQYKSGVQKLLLFILPFVAYLWLLYIVPNIWFVAILSAVFYLLITTKSYVAMCKQHGDLGRVIED